MEMNFSGNIIILTHWSFKDALIQTTLPYVFIIRDILPSHNKIIIVTSEQEKIALSEDEVQKINREWESKNILIHPLPYKKMGLKKMLASTSHLLSLLQMIRKENISTIHSFCTPAGAIGYMLSKLSGAKLIIDSYEPHAESMVENGTWTKKSLAFRLLFWFEKRQTQRARFFVATSGGMKDYAKKKYHMVPQPFFVKPACVDLEKFNWEAQNEVLLKKLGLEDKLICIYAGKLGGIYLNDEVFDFIAECYSKWGEKFRFLMLTNASREEVLLQMERVKLPEYLVIQKFVNHEDVPKYLSLGHFAINPVKPVPTKRYCTSIKDGEYWATGLPVVITKNISDDSRIIADNQIGYVLDSLCKDEYKKAILEIERILSIPKETIRLKIRSIAEKYRSFEIAKKIYTKIYS